MNFSKEKVEIRTKKLNSASTHRKYKLQLIGIRLFFIALSLSLCIAVSALAGIFHRILSTVPDIDNIQVVPQGYTTSVVDSGGKIIQTLGGTNANWEYVTLDSIPPNLQNAFVATEDERFFEHNGIDLQGVLHTLADSFRDGNGVPTYPNTLTQQLVRNQIFNRSDEVSLTTRIIHNIQERHLALQLEQKYDKKQILEYYLNTINLGQNTIGVQAASKRYFNKNVSDLTLSECAVLAGTAKNPSEYEPVTHPKRNRKRCITVLTCMKEQGYITNDDYTLAIQDDVYPRIPSVSKEVPPESADTTYFTDAVIEQVMEDLKAKLGYSETQAYNTLYTRGLTIYTTQDSSMQKICDRIINGKKYFPTAANQQISFVLIDQYTGEVRALCGGRGKKSTKSVNRATGMLRQPGSVFPVLSAYLPALDTCGMTLATVQDDAEYHYPDTKIKVRNWYGESYQGLSSIRTAITDSMSVPAVKTLQQIGPKTGYDYLLNLGFTSLVDTYTDTSGKSYTDISLPMAVGTLTKGVSNLELTNSFASIANGGNSYKPKLYTKILDRNGKILIEHSTESSKRIMKDSTAWLLTSAMSDVVKKGTGTPLKWEHNSISLAGKNGFSTGNRDLWFIGYTPYLTAGIWVGYDSAQKQNSSSAHENMWYDIMKALHTGYPDKKFTRPDSITTATICTKCGKLAIQGLCSQAVGGSCEKVEYFAKDTVPTETCDCHVRCRICKSSGHLAGNNCPVSDIYTAIYLQKKEPSTGDAESSLQNTETADAPLIIPSYLTNSLCEVHN